MTRLLRYSIFFVIFSACVSHFHVSEVKTTHYELKTSKNDSITNLSVLPYKEKLDKEMNQIIAYSDSALTRDGFESSLGNFVLKAMEGLGNFIQTDTTGDFVFFMNRGGLRNNLPMGDITKGNIFELMPFDNEIVMISLSAEKLNEAINGMLKENKLISFHITMDIKEGKAENIMVNRSAFDSGRSYFIVTTDYLAMGGDNCHFFKDPLAYIPTTLKLRDVILKYCESLTKNNMHIKPVRLGTIKISK